MTDFSHIFYPERSEYDGMVHKFIPDRTIDRSKLTIVFFQNREQDYWASISDVYNNQRDETIVESLEQLREVAGLLDIHVVEIPRQQHGNPSEQIKMLSINPRQILFLAITQLDHNLIQEVNNLIYSGYQIIIGTCGSMVLRDEWSNYRDLESRDERLHGWHGGDASARKRYNTPNGKKVKMIHVLEFIDILLWEEFRMDFRKARLMSHGIPIVRDIVIPCLRQLGIGEPQFRLHWREGINGKYVKEFALAVDWEPSDTSRVKLVFRQPIENKPNSLRERFFGKSEKVYRFCQTERDYICLQIISEYDIGCCFTTISKDPKKSISEINKEAEQLMQKSEEAAKDFLEQNAEAVLQIGKIPKHGTREIYPFKTLRSQEWDDFHIRDALRVSIEMIGNSILSIINPLASLGTQWLAERLYKQKTKPNAG